jgi:hypothetical protein
METKSSFLSELKTNLTTISTIKLLIDVTKKLGKNLIH